MADMLNHSTSSPVIHKYIDKNLHLQQNKIYLYETDYETFDYDKSDNKASVNVKRLFKDDNVKDMSLIEGDAIIAPEPHPDCFARFKAVGAQPEIKHEEHGN